MNPGMLLFGLFDSGLAFFLVYSVSKAKFGGNQSGLARALGAVLGTITFVVYFGVIVWFNTEAAAATAAVKALVYAGPIVLSVLMVVLVLLSAQPEPGASEEAEAESDGEEEEGNLEADES